MRFGALVLVALAVSGCVSSEELKKQQAVGVAAVEKAELVHVSGDRYTLVTSGAFPTVAGASISYMQGALGQGTKQILVQVSETPDHFSASGWKHEEELTLPRHIKFVSVRAFHELNKDSKEITLSVAGAREK